MPPTLGYTAPELSLVLLPDWTPTSSVCMECASATIEFAVDGEKPGVRSGELSALALASLNTFS